MVVAAAVSSGATPPRTRAVDHAGSGTNPIAVLRLGDQVSQLRIDPRGRFLAFQSGISNARGSIDLKVLDLKTSVITPVARTAAGPVFSWAPDGFRLIYSEARKSQGSKDLARQRVAQLDAGPGTVAHDGIATLSAADHKFASTQVFAFDAALGKSKAITKIPSAAGFPTMDSRALGAYLLTPDGLTTIKLTFPDDRLAKWQTENTVRGKFVATSGGMVWIQGRGDGMTRLDDDGSALQSFAVSPDGSAVTWSTADGYIYRSIEGSPAELIDRGRDPSWHPDRSEIVYAGAVMSGNRIAGYDLKIHGARGKRFLTRTPYSDERWPQWQSGTQRILYTVERTTDIFMIDTSPVGG